ncbi:allantoicase [Corynebacterium sp.]|uniref:allantoicase n=1 Tax=Corynebacterium sp. TaxID=1720 RepID=UPI0028AD5F65|nr:allantoicase [Corynebacterium sp.]
MTSAASLTDLAARANGGSVLSASDEFFVPKESLIRSTEPVSRKGESGERGGMYDGWETRRRRDGESDWVIVRLGEPGLVDHIVVDTAFFRGNYPAAITIETIYHLGHPTNDELEQKQRWTTAVAHGACQGDSKNEFSLESPVAATHVRLWIHPDGGVARLHVLGRILPDPRRHHTNSFDVAALDNGGTVVDQSDNFFNPASNVIRRGAASTTKDGWETRRRRGPGHDWLRVRLGSEARIQQIVIDTSCYIGNAPQQFQVSVCTSTEENPGEDAGWTTLLGKQSLLADQVHYFIPEVSTTATHVQLDIFPDGGLARFRVIGLPTLQAREETALRWLAALPIDTAIELLRQIDSTMDPSLFVSAAGSAHSISTLVEALDAASDSAVGETLCRLVNVEEEFREELKERVATW